MKINILSVGNKLPTWINEGCSEYLKRFTKDFEVNLKEIKPERRNNNQNIEQILTIEETKIRENIPSQSQLVILDERGKGISTIDFANYLTKWQNENINPCFIIGSADGISAHLKKEAFFNMQLSQMTLAHGLARIMLVEQLYRAVSIIHHHPYHRV
ncbi:MAG: 23S rRNA (pseudouridine(1915)-N(3))-methyltransferase RlmH [Neisseriaceae bacterium]|nr:23S rRNA (pseudouridine(1915)-N(3))-methyltransferase RlmH [Neisseriaceae bacterium]